MDTGEDGIEEAGIGEAAIGEVTAIHGLFEDWFSGQIELEAGLDPIGRRLAPEFGMVTPRGEVVGRDVLLDSLAANHGQYEDPDAFTIEVDEPAVLVGAENRALVSYVERQHSPEGETARRSSAWFRADVDAPEGVVWVHLHETWTPDGAPE